MKSPRPCGASLLWAWYSARFDRGRPRFGLPLFFTIRFIVYLQTDVHVIYSICLCLRDNGQMEKAKKKIETRHRQIVKEDNKEDNKTDSKGE
jgi:hypothetical protein